MNNVVRFLFIAIVTFTLVLSGAHASETVITQGIGTTCDDALRQAKSLATERVAGSFLKSQRTLRNDTSLEESLNEYTGGVVTSFKILQTDGAQPCTVSIQASVDIEQTKIIAPPIARNSLDLGHIGAVIEKRKDASDIVSKLINRPDQFTVDISDVSYTAGSGMTQIDFEIKRITSSAQWRADLEALLSVQSKPQIYEQPGLGTIAKGLLALVALPVLIPAAIIAAPFSEPQPKRVPQNPDTSICFSADNKLDKLACYDGPVAAEIVKQLSEMTYFVVLKDPSNKLYRISTNQRLFMVHHYWSPVALEAEGSTEKRQRFILIGSSDFPRKEQLYVDDHYLKQGMGLAFVVGKPTQE